MKITYRQLLTAIQEAESRRDTARFYEAAADRRHPDKREELMRYSRESDDSLDEVIQDWDENA